MTDAKFWDKGARKYATKPIGNMEAYEKTLAKTRAYLKKDMRALELGAGTGTTALKLADSVESIKVTDYSPEMVSIGQEKAKASGVDNLSFEVGEISDFQRQNAKYDVVMAFNFLHLTLDLSATVKGVANVLADDGLFISKSATISGKYALIRPIVAVMRWLGKAPFLNAFSEQDLIEVHEAAGFEIVEAVRIPQSSMILFVVARKKAA